MSAPRPAPVSWGRPDSGSASGTRPAGKAHAGPDFLGKYRIISEIGRGGMASVHLGRVDGPGGFYRWVAVKRIHPHLVDNDHVVDMFLDEGRVTAGISHANVAQVFELGKDTESYWLAMEYVHGEPLREITRLLEETGTRMQPNLAARICADAAEGLHAAHELRGKSGQLLGLVHRDVSPHNLMVTYDGCTKVVDFGIALAAERLAKTLHHGQLKGKLAYMSPEQIRNEPLDRKSDIFALGVVLWELTTGQRLFRGDTDLDTLEKAQACRVPRPSQVVADYPLGLEQICLKALAKDPNERFATARELSRALQEYLIRSGSYVGPEEVAGFVRSLFSERIERRDAHLAWAAEVTSTHDAPRESQPPGVPARRSDDTLTPSETATELHDRRSDLPHIGADDSSDEEEVQTIALQLSDQQVVALRQRQLGPRSHGLAPLAAMTPLPIPVAVPPPAPSAPSGVVPMPFPDEVRSHGFDATRTGRMDLVVPLPERRKDSPLVLFGLFVATVTFVLAFAALLRWVATLL